jgi:hypothetical protein
VKSSEAKKLPIGSILIFRANPIHYLVELVEIEMMVRWIIRPLSTITHSMRPTGEIPVYAKDLWTLQQYKEKNPKQMHNAVSSIFDKERSLL